MMILSGVKRSEPHWWSPHGQANQWDSPQVASAVGSTLDEDMLTTGIYIYILHTYIHACMHAYMHTYMHACMHTYIHTHIHTYIYCIYGYNWINWITAGLMWYNMVYIRMYNCIITYNVCNKNMDLLPEQKWLHIRSPQWLTSSVPSKARLGGFKLQDWTTK